MIDELEVVTLVRPSAEYGLAAGAIGTVVMVHESGAGYTVEFMTPEGQTLAIATLDAPDVRLATSAEIARWRGGAEKSARSAPCILPPPPQIY